MNGNNFCTLAISLVRVPIKPSLLCIIFARSLSACSCISIFSRSACRCISNFILIVSLFPFKLDSHIQLTTRSWWWRHRRVNTTSPSSSSLSVSSTDSTSVPLSTSTYSPQAYSERDSTHNANFDFPAHIHLVCRKYYHHKHARGYHPWAAPRILKWGYKTGFASGASNKFFLYPHFPNVGVQASKYQ